MSIKPWYLEDEYKFEGEHDQDLIEFTEKYGDDTLYTIMEVISNDGTKYLKSNGNGALYVESNSSVQYSSPESQSGEYTGTVKCELGEYNITLIDSNSDGTRIMEWFKEVL